MWQMLLPGIYQKCDLDVKRETWLVLGTRCHRIYPIILLIKQSNWATKLSGSQLLTSLQCVQQTQHKGHKKGRKPDFRAEKTQCRLM